MSNNTSYKCPECGSENIQSYPMVYQSGIVNTSSGSSGTVALNTCGSFESTTTGMTGLSYTSTSSNGSITSTSAGMIKTSSKGMNISHLASTCQPPNEPTLQKYKGSGCLFSILVVIALIFISPGLCGVFIVLRLIYFFIRESPNEEKEKAIVEKRNEELLNDYHEKLSTWEHSYLCFKCGNRFVLNSNNQRQQATTSSSHSFQVLLESVGNQKINVIKTIRTIRNLNLNEAKNLVDNVPSVIGEGLSEKDAINIKDSLEIYGAKVTLNICYK